tara:strand:- start:54866 stop:55756 length:891 start_codon:yes stop_codon:yes gene_type:complete
MTLNQKGILANLYADEDLAQNICRYLNIPNQTILQHDFPDQETCIKTDWPCKDQDIYLLTSIEHPNKKILPLTFAAESLRQKGAKSITLVAPYLPYMRQDKAFHPGEGISAYYFAKLVSVFFDGLVTMDPHLHRIKNLSEIYTIPTNVVHAAPAIAAWIAQHIEAPLIIGPDSESEQWVKATANIQNLPFIALDKVRKGDESVEIQMKDLSLWENKTPILIDDIISSGHTIIETCKHLKILGFPSPIVIGIHGVFANNAYKKLKPYCKNIYTTNTILHESNKIDISESLAIGISKM